MWSVTWIQVIQGKGLHDPAALPPLQPSHPFSNKYFGKHCHIQMQPVLFGLDRRNHAGAIPGKGTPEQPRDSAIIWDNTNKKNKSKTKLVFQCWKCEHFHKWSNNWVDFFVLDFKSWCRNFFHCKLTLKNTQTEIHDPALTADEERSWIKNRVIKKIKASFKKFDWSKCLKTYKLKYA